MAAPRAIQKKATLRSFRLRGDRLNMDYILLGMWAVWGMF